LRRASVDGLAKEAVGVPAIALAKSALVSRLPTAPRSSDAMTSGRRIRSGDATRRQQIVSAAGCSPPATTSASGSSPWRWLPVDQRADRRGVAADDGFEDRLGVRRRDQHGLSQGGDPDDHQEHAEDEEEEDRSSWMGEGPEHGRTPPIFGRTDSRPAYGRA
jgi:hypothetical protein